MDFCACLMSSQRDQHTFATACLLWMRQCYECCLATIDASWLAAIALTHIAYIITNAASQASSEMCITKWLSVPFTRPGIWKWEHSTRTKTAVTLRTIMEECAFITPDQRLTDQPTQAPALREAKHPAFMLTSQGGCTSGQARDSRGCPGPA